MDTLLRQSNIHQLLILGESWCNMLTAVVSHRRSRAELVDRLRRLRGMFSHAFDALVLQASLKQSRTLSQYSEDRCHLPTCPNCPDKFYCLTTDFVSLLRCLRCGTKMFYTIELGAGPNANNIRWLNGEVALVPDYVGGDEYCPLSNLGGRCVVCGFCSADYEDEEDDGMFAQYFRDELTEVLTKVHITYEKRTARMNPRALFHILQRCRGRSVVTLGDFIDLLQPEPDTLRGYDWTRFSSQYVGTPEDPIYRLIDQARLRLSATPPTNILKNIAMEGKDAQALRVYLANMWNRPPPTLVSAMTMRYPNDPVAQAVSMLTPSAQVLLGTLY